MARYRKIDPRIWNDEKFRELSDNAKLAFLFLLTHPHMTALGAMRATIAGLAEELGWDAEAFREAFGEALFKGMAEHDQKACFIAIPNFIRYNSPESPNVVKAWVSALDLLPECDLKTRTVARAGAFAKALPEAFAKAFTEAFAKGMPYQEQEQEQEKKQEQKPKKATAEQAQLSPKAGITFEAFIDHCQSVGEKPIPEDDPIFEYVQKVGIDQEMLAVAWQEFKAAFLGTAKKQKDWRSHFRNAVRRNWYKLWFLKDGEQAGWTTAGEQARRAAA